MKSGNLQNKPTMSARPPGSAPQPTRTADEALSDLAKVDALTETPARSAAQSLEEEGGAEATPVTVTAPAAKQKAAPKNAMPWDAVEEEGSVSFNFKLPNKLAAKLKYLGGTTYGESMTSIVTSAVETRVEKMLKERKLL